MIGYLSSIAIALIIGYLTGVALERRRLDTPSSVLIEISEISSPSDPNQHGQSYCYYVLGKDALTRRAVSLHKYQTVEAAKKALTDRFGAAGRGWTEHAPERPA